MCDCVKQLEERLLERFKENHNDYEQEPKVIIENKTLMLVGKKSYTSLTSQGRFEYVRKTRTGHLSRKKEKFNIAYKYCPFCGQPYEGE